MYRVFDAFVDGAATWKVEKYIAGPRLVRQPARTGGQGSHRSGADGDGQYLQREMVDGTAIPHRLGPGYRIYLTLDRDKLILLSTDGTKASQKGDIKHAKQLGDVLRRNLQATMVSGTIYALW